MTDKQQRFVAEYLVDMNAKQAAISAGYSQKTAYSIGNELLRKPEISQAIDAAMTERRNKLIADRQERQMFWTETMRDAGEDMRNRLKSSELLAKSFGDFTEKREIQAEVSCSDYDWSKLTESELLQLRGLLVKATPTSEKTRKELNLLNLLTEN